MRTPTDPILQGIPGWFATATLGLVALVLSLLPFLGPLAPLRLVDLPLTGGLFLACAWIALRTRRGTDWALLGMLVAASGFAISVLSLLLQRDHPWRP